MASLLQVSPVKSCLNLFSAPIRATWPAHLFRLHLVTRTIIREEALQMWSKKEMAQNKELERTYYRVHSNIGGDQLNVQYRQQQCFTLWWLWILRLTNYAARCHGYLMSANSQSSCTEIQTVESRIHYTRQREQFHLTDFIWELSILLILQMSSFS